MTYRLDSDVLWSYGEIIDIKTGKMVAPSTSVQWREPENFQGNFKFINQNNLLLVIFFKTMLSIQ
jgi:hypothetical protein